MKSYCWSCKGQTNHDIKYEKIVDWGEETRGNTKHQMVECKGCENITYRKEYTDYESMVSVEDGNFEPEVTDSLYPQEQDFNTDIDVHYLPEPTNTIFGETLRALNSRSFALAAIGLRATLESICKHQGIASRTLEQKINELLKKGKISVAEKDRLHAIRFLGNDAAHEMVAPRKESIAVALKIIENTLFQLYIIDKKANWLLEYPLSGEQEILELLNEKVDKLSVGAPTTLSAIFAGALRRIPLKGTDLSKLIESKIADGTITKIAKSAYADPSTPGIPYFEKI